MMPDEVRDGDWQQVPCVIADIIRSNEFITVDDSSTDLFNNYGPPTIYTSWVTKETTFPVLKEWWWHSPLEGEKDRQKCEHYVPTIRLH